MDAEGDDMSAEDSRTATLGRKRSRQSSDDERTVGRGLGSKAPASRHDITERARTGSGGERIAGNSRMDMGSYAEPLSVPEDVFDQDGYAGLPHESEMLLTDLGQQSIPMNGTQTYKHVHQSQALPGESVHVTMDNTDERDDVELIFSEAVLPTVPETSTRGINDSRAYEQKPGQETGTVPGFFVTDADRKAIVNREMKRTRETLHRKGSKKLANGVKVTVSVDFPDVAIRHMGKQQEALRWALEYHIARHALKGLKAIYYPVSDHQQDDTGEERFQALLCYSCKASPAAIEGLQDHPLAIWGKTKPVTVSVLDFVSEDWAIANDIFKTFINARVNAIIDRLRTGDLRREHYGPLRSLDDSKKSKKDKGENRHKTKEPVDANQEIQPMADNLSNAYDSVSPTDAAPVDLSTEPVYWFQDTADGVPRCQMCIRKGHSEEECPSRMCRHCRAPNEHFSSACPTRRRCAKCHQAGHAKDECSTTSSISAKVLPCDLCQRQGHTEEQCSLLWRTFFPENLSDVKKVGRLIISCYYCGASSHWGDDCPLKQQSSAYLSSAASNTFSSREAAYFLYRPEEAEGNGIVIKGRAGAAGDNIKDENEDIPSRADLEYFQQAYQDRCIRAAAASNNEQPRIPRLGRLEDLIFQPANGSIKEEDAYGINGLQLNIRQQNGNANTEHVNSPATIPTGLSNRSNADSLEAQRAARLAMMSPNDAREQHVQNVQIAQKRKRKASKNANLLPLGNANRFGDRNAQELNGGSTEVGANGTGVTSNIAPVNAATMSVELNAQERMEKPRRKKKSFALEERRKHNAGMKATQSISS